jgi:predicted metal-binding protein
MWKIFICNTCKEIFKENTNKEKDIQGKNLNKVQTRQEIKEEPTVLYGCWVKLNVVGVLHCSLPLP